MGDTVGDRRPPTPAQPMAFWPPAPAPFASASGRTPKTKAKLVIRIGRRRSLPASSAARAGGRPSRIFSSANSTIRMAFLADTPMVVIRPEGHTSELQSLMRISYAVFCLKKKKNQEENKSHTRTHTQKRNHME